MKNIELYEKIPELPTLVKINLYDNIRNPLFPIHWHGHLEIHYIIEGTAVVRCENDVCRLRAGDCIIINSNELHEGLDGSCRHLCILVPWHFIKNNNIILRRVVKDSQIEEMAKCIIKEYKSHDKAQDIAVLGYVALILTRLYRNYVFKEMKAENYKAYSERILLLNEVVKFIHENYCDDLQLCGITERFNVNMYHFCHIFKDFTGKTFKDYLNKVRIDKAEEFLMNTDVPISEIAFLCGFNDSNYFSRKFRQIKGKTPRELRKDTICG